MMWSLSLGLVEDKVGFVLLSYLLFAGLFVSDNCLADVCRNPNSPGSLALALLLTGTRNGQVASKKEQLGHFKVQRLGNFLQGPE